MPADDAADVSRLPYRPCVGIMIVNAAGQVWVGRRIDGRNDPEGRGNWWQMPQGGIDAGEDPRFAARREVAEETGIRSIAFIGESAGWHTYDLPPHLVGRAWGGRYRGQRQKWFVARFTGDDREIDISPPPPHQVEFDRWRWAPPGELIDLIIPFKRDVYRAVLKELGHLAAPFSGP